MQFLRLPRPGQESAPYHYSKAPFISMVDRCYSPFLFGGPHRNLPVPSSAGSPGRLVLPKGGFLYIFLQEKLKHTI